MSGGIGVGCVALALFFVVPGFETPDEVFGAFVPTAVAMLAVGPTVAAIMRGQSPYVLGALLPAAAIGAVLRSARGFARLRSSASGLAPESR